MRNRSDRQHLVVAGYVLVLVALVLAWWNPNLPIGTSSPQLVLVIDRSASMQHRDNQATANAIESIAAAWPLGGSMTALGDAHATGAMSVADVISGLRSGTTWPVAPDESGNGSNIETALRNALSAVDRNRPAAIVLVSDAIETGGDASAALREAARQSVPVYVLQPPERHGVVDAWIHALDAPVESVLSQKIPVRLGISATTATAATLQLHVDGEKAYEKTLRLTADLVQTLTAWLDFSQPGAREITATVLAEADANPHNNDRATIVNVRANRAIAAVSKHPERNPLLAGLRTSDRRVVVVAPDRFSTLAPRLSDVDTLVLDDISVNDMSDRDWALVEDAVRVRGLGLVVLGGPHAFSGGAYRHSRLEQLLPVTSESGKPEQSSAVMFVVDKSGSMDRAANGIDRNSLAQRAVIETTRGLESGDAVGLIAFDVTPVALLDLDTRADPVSALKQVWPTASSGGTRLAPALNLALDALETTPASQRILALVTDGFVPAEALEPLQRRIAAHGITLLAFAVGDNVDTTVLSELAVGGGGRLFAIDDALTLPRLMREEIEQRRRPAVVERTRTLAPLPPPFMTAMESWPMVAGYMVTKPKASTTVHLAAPNGDPLLASWEIGAGRVIALPAGLGAWTPEWPNWDRWPVFAGGLVQWVAAQHVMEQTYLHASAGTGKLDVVLDTTDALQSATDGTLVLRDIHGQIRDHALTLVAPGRYTAAVPLSGDGRYTFGVRAGGRRASYDVLYRNPSELQPSPQQRDAFGRWTALQLVQPWTPGQPLTPGAGSSRSLQWLFLIAAVGFYLLTIATERGLMPPASNVANILQRQKTYRQLTQKIDRVRNAA